MKLIETGVLVALLATTPALAQQPDKGDAPERDRVVGALELPQKAESLRKKGVPEGEVREALEAASDKGVPANETAEAFEAADQAAEDHGRIDNFGSFVQSQLEQGLRGQELAAAIHAEHEARGMGRGKAKGKAGEAGQGRAGEVDMGRPDEAGRPDMSGGKGGKPDTTGGEEEAEGARGAMNEAGRGGKGQTKRPTTDEGDEGDEGGMRRPE